MKNKSYFAHDIFPVFLLVFFLFTILWTNCNKIVFTQIPKALSVLVLGKKKKKSVLESQTNLENSLLPFFLNYDFVFSQVLPKFNINKNSNFIQFPPPSPPQFWKN